MEDNNATNLSKQEKSLLDTVEENMNPPENVFAFTEQRSCADLVRLCKSRQLDLEPDFQRKIVWPAASQTRFVDSLLKQLPIPSMCFSMDSATKMRTVIDGLQRTSTIAKFLDEDEEWTLSNIEDVDPRIKGRSNIDIRDNNPEVWAIIQNAMLPVTVIRCDYSSAIDMEYLYMIFHRLNTGAASLNNQEIRNCIFTGELNTQIKESANKSFVTAYYGRNWRFKNEEYILRALAFHAKLNAYSGKLSKFLNEYMQENRHADKSQDIALLTSSLSLILDKWNLNLGKMSKTVKEALLFGVMQNYVSLSNDPLDLVIERYDAFKNNPIYNAESLSNGLTSKKNVQERLWEASRIFG